VNAPTAREERVAVLKLLQRAAGIERRLAIFGEYSALSVIRVRWRGEHRAGGQQEGASACPGLIPRFGDSAADQLPSVAQPQGGALVGGNCANAAAAFASARAAVFCGSLSTVCTR
jgi:hypothetical protein